MDYKADLWLVLIAFVIAVVAGLFLIPWLRKVKAGQSILKYVDMHAAKAGTPTMGGLIFILPIILVGAIFINWDTPLCLIVIVASCAYGIVGFLDDFLKIKNHQNLGLRPYQKIIGQLGIALLVAVFYLRSNPSGEIWVPFFNVFWQIGGVGIFALTLLILIATTNAVNLTDGLDGLAGTTSLIYLIFIYVIIALTDIGAEITTVGNLIAVAIGSLLGYLVFNTKKASVFMGDTGSLFLGGFIAMISLFSGLGFALLFLGIVFVWSALSTIIQVVFFKISKGKRIFLMAPFHHHLEKTGMHESKIVAVYAVVTIIMGIVLVLSVMYV
ncbi:MAG: phospho-N-acetylmuramoyl-pentapeptide-transferase [Clostridia bacterium]|nr:phospho-N-acetylmuramoyl-pentapeptide-transferase [Clostridia bacterium]